MCAEETCLSSGVVVYLEIVVYCRAGEIRRGRGDIKINKWFFKNNALKN